MDDSLLSCAFTPPPVADDVSSLPAVSAPIPTPEVDDNSPSPDVSWTTAASHPGNSNVHYFQLAPAHWHIVLDMCVSSPTSLRGDAVAVALQELQESVACNERFFMTVAVHMTTSSVGRTALVVGAVWGERMLSSELLGVPHIVMLDVHVHPAWAKLEHLHLGSTLFTKFAESIRADCVGDLNFTMASCISGFTRDYFEHVFRSSENHFRSLGCGVARFVVEGVTKLVVSPAADDVVSSPFFNIDAVDAVDAAAASDQGEWLPDESVLRDPTRINDDAKWLEHRRLPNLKSLAAWRSEGEKWLNGGSGEHGDLFVELTVFDSLKTAFAKSLGTWLQRVLSNATFTLHGYQKPAQGTAEAGDNNCAYEAAAVMAELLSRNVPLQHVGRLKRALHHVTWGNQLLKQHEDKFNLKRSCDCHSQPLDCFIDEQPDVAHFLSGPELLHLVKGFSPFHSSEKVELTHRDNVVRFIASTIEDFWNGKDHPKAIDLGNMQRMHLACANSDPRGMNGTHWVAVALRFSWKPKPNRLLRRQVRRQPPSPAPPSPTLTVARPTDAKLRKLFGSRVFYVIQLHTTYCYCRIPLAPEKCFQELEDGHVLDQTNSLLLVWIVGLCDARGDTQRHERHVVVGPSSVCEGSGLFLWHAPAPGYDLGVYSGNESLPFAMESSAEAYAFTLPLEQRNFVLLRKRLGGWAVVDASVAHDECFVRFVNDPHNTNREANTRFNAHAVLSTRYVARVNLPNAYDLHQLHTAEFNKHAELLCAYRDDGAFFANSS